MCSIKRCLLSEAAAKWPGEPFVVGSDRVLSFDEADKRALGIARLLLESGVKPGERVGICLPVSVDYPLLLLALWRIGAVACPINERFPDVYISERLESIGCRRLITDFAQSHITNVELMALPSLSAAGRMPEVGDGSRYDFERPAIVIFTSGSQGNPKGVMHSVAQHNFNALGANENIRLRVGDRWLLSLPLFHVGGLAILFRCLISGASVVLPNKEYDVVDQIERFRVSHLSVVSTQLKRIVEHPRASSVSSQLKAVLLGGGPSPKWLIQAAIQRDFPLFCTYGLTEMGSQVTTTAPDASLDELTSSGKVLKYRDIRLDERGRIFVRGQTRFIGFANAGGIEEPFDEDGWYRTSDIGSIDAQGRLTVLGRTDNVFISGGENVQPEVIEAELLEISRAERVAVVPVDDREYGKRPVAFIAGSFSEEELLKGLRAGLPAYMIPVKLFAWPQDASESQLKFDREELRRIAETLILVV